MKLLIILLVINCIILFFYLHNIENFTDTPLLIYNVNENPNHINIDMKENEYSSDIIDISKNIKNIDINNTEIEPNIILTDSLNYKVNYPDYKLLTILSKPKYTLFIKPKDTFSNQSLRNVIDKQLTIGYFTETDKKIIEYLCIAQNQDPYSLKLIKIDIPDIIDETIFLNINILCVSITLQDNIFIEKIPLTFKIDFIDYDRDSDNFIDKIKFFIPFALLEDIDLTVYFKSFKDEYIIKTALVLDMILIGPESTEINNDLGLTLNSLLVYNKNFDKINYYSLYFPVFKHSIAYIQSENKHIIKRDSLPILEQYQDYYDAQKQILYISYDDTIKLYDRVILNNQNRQEENGEYIVTEINLDKNIKLQKMLFYDAQNFKMSDDEIYIRTNELIDNIPLDAIKTTDIIYITKLKKTAKLDKSYLGIPILKLLNQEENPTYDPRYECYDQPQIKSRGLCESTNNIWDRRCEVNTDCPFYQANKNYKNYLGGCMDGYCQMPIGVKPLAYKQYEGKAYCYNCDSTTPFCCEQQEKPDYAFSLDEFERKNVTKE